MIMKITMINDMFKVNYLAISAADDVLVKFHQRQQSLLAINKIRSAVRYVIRHRKWRQSQHDTIFRRLRLLRLNMTLMEGTKHCCAHKSHWRWGSEAIKQWFNWLLTLALALRPNCLPLSRPAMTAPTMRPSLANLGGWSIVNRRLMSILILRRCTCTHLTSCTSA